MCDSMCFSAPEQKKEKFSVFREDILKQDYVSVKTLQRFAGKCNSLSLAIPGARMNTRVINASISKLVKYGGRAKMLGPLK